MKKIILLFCLAIASTLATAQPPMGPPPGGWGQRGGEQDQASRQERMYQKIQDELGMSREEAEKFAPVYRQYQGELRNIQKDLKTFTDSFAGKELTDAESNSIIKAQLDAELETVRVKKEFLKVFKKYLNPTQMAKVFMMDKKGRGRGHGQGHGRPDGQSPQERMPRE